MTRYRGRGEVDHHYYKNRCTVEMTVKRRAVSAIFYEFNFNNMSDVDISVGNGVDRLVAIYISNGMILRIAMG